SSTATHFPYTTLFRSNEWIGTPCEHEDAGLDFAGLRRRLGGERAVERHHGGQRGARARHVEHYRAPEAIADRRDARGVDAGIVRSEEHTSELQSRFDL